MPERVAFDASAVVDGTAARLVGEGSIQGLREVIIPRAVLDELQARASRNVESGVVGLRALGELRSLCGKRGIGYRVYGGPGSSAMDAVREAGATLYTSDYVAHLTAEALGIPSTYMRREVKTEGLLFEQFFDEETMSVHLKEGVPPMAKKGRPGNFRLEVVGEQALERSQLEEMAKEVLEAARVAKDSFVELEANGATVVQLGQYRIAMARQPFSDGLELTAVRPLVKLSLEEYGASDRLIGRLRERAEGVLIAGPPGSGKSTLATALAEFYRGMGKVVKTLESPRDLQVGPEITQYGPLEGDFERTAEILLLVRPDYTVFDEVRKTKDFEVFTDLRLAGVGMVGVVHASSPIDAIQRLMGRVELGMIPHVVDTVLFVRAGGIERVLELSLTVKVPTGMTEADLARPVVEVKDFDSGELAYEIYAFGEEEVVVPVGELRHRGKGRGGRGDSREEAEGHLLRIVRRLDPEAEVEVEGSRAIVRISREGIPKLVGRGGEGIMGIERSLGLRVSIQPREGGGGGEGILRRRRKK